MNKTRIEWTDYSWNPFAAYDIETGKRGWFCTHVSEGCRNCYSERANLWRGNQLAFTAQNESKVEFRMNEKELQAPLRLTKPSRIFVCDMSDLFHEKVLMEFLLRVFEVMAAARQHTFQVLTKRPERALRCFAYPKGKMACESAEHHRLLCTMPLPNVWFGVSAEDQETADERVPLLLQTPAAVRFVSYEPALGPVDLSPWLSKCVREPMDDGTFLHSDGLDWVIAGGESGPKARPSHPQWFRDVRDQCQAAAVPFFFKQWGEWFPRDQWEDNPLLTLPDDDCAYIESSTTHVFESFEGPCPVHRVGKKRARRLLDGRGWNEFPRISQ